MKGFTRVPLVSLLAFAFAFGVLADTPTIDPSQPADVTVNVASAADFSIVATNAVSYQWQTNGVNVPNATNSTFALDDVTANLQVDVIVAGTDQSITSRVAQLTVVPGTIVNLTISGYQSNQTSTVSIQLFDHDKPATVQNFIHYITSGAYTNMFFDRMIPNFVLQGGDYGASSRTNDDTPVDNSSDEIYSVDTSFVQNFAVSPNLPLWIDNEYNVGPIIHNRFGTIAAAKKSGDPNSAENAFFFNLGDNSTNLDNQNGGFTVFGRVVAGTNVLNYFNTLSKPDSGIFDESRLDSQPAFTDLPVNYSGFAIPVNTNLFYADFAFPSGYPVDTTMPSVVRTNVTVDPNSGDVQFFGTASDNLSLARVWANVFSTTPSASVGPVNSVGLTNWSIDAGVLPAGSNYTLTLSVQDGAGNLLDTNYTLAVAAQPLRVTTNGRGSFTPAHAASTNMSYLQSVVLKAKPAANTVFVGWTIGTNKGSIDASFAFTNINGGVVTANFITNNMPGAFHFTAPTASQKLTNPVVTLSGAVAKTAVAPVSVTARVYSRTTDALLFTGATTNFTNNAWTLQTPAFAPGLYRAQAIATGPTGKSAVAYQNFDVLAAVSVVVNGPGKTSVKAGTNFFEINTLKSIVATPLAGSSFHDWTGSTGLERLTPTTLFVLSAEQSIDNPLVLTATFYSNDVVKTAFTITSPKAGQTVYQSSVTVQGTAIGLTRVTCQAFTNNTLMEPTTDVVNGVIDGTNWSAVLTGFPPGSQKIVAIGYDAQGRTREIEQTITVNLLPTAAGNYAGLFYASPETTLDSGMFTVTITSNGTASGKIQFPGVSLIYPIHTKFPNSGDVLFSPGGFQGQNLLVLMELFAYPNVITGEIGLSTAAEQLFGYRQASSLSSTNNLTAGNYVLLLTPLNATVGLPVAPGYALLTVNSNATYQLAGALPDTNTFSASSIVSDNGYIPVFSIPSSYGTKGAIIGWQSFTSNSVNVEQLEWIKGATTGGYYPGAFASAQVLQTSGGIAAPPTNGQYSIVFSSGTLTNSITNTLTFANGQFSTGSNVSSINFATNGVLTGNFVDPSGTTERFQGAFANPAVGGGGFVIQPNSTNTAKFQLTASP